MTWERAFEKCIFHNFLDIFLQTFLLYVTGLWIFFANLQIFLKIKKVEHKSFPMMYHIRISNIGFKRLVNYPPPPSAYPMGFKYPSRDRGCSCKQKRQDDNLYIVNHISSNKSSKGTVVNRAGPSLNARSLRLTWEDRIKYFYLRAVRCLASS